MSPDDADGYSRYEQLFARIRRALRSEPHDTWVGDAPDRPALEELLNHDAELIEVMFEESDRFGHRASRQGRAAPHRASWSGFDRHVGGAT